MTHDRVPITDVEVIILDNGIEHGTRLNDDEQAGGPPIYGAKLFQQRLEMKAIRSRPVSP